MRLIAPYEAPALVGESLGTSEWHLVDQDSVDAFAAVTGDHQFIHVDPVAAKQTPFGGTIAHGVLPLSLLASLMPDGVLVVEGATMGVNYGFDKVRFLQPVPTGSRIRAHHVLAGFEDKGNGRFLTTTTVTVEIEGVGKPALVAEWLGMQYT